MHEGLDGFGHFSLRPPHLCHRKTSQLRVNAPLISHAEILPFSATHSLIQKASTLGNLVDSNLATIFTDAEQAKDGLTRCGSFLILSRRLATTIVPTIASAILVVVRVVVVVIVVAATSGITAPTAPAVVVSSATQALESSSATTSAAEERTVWIPVVIF